MEADIKTATAFHEAGHAVVALVLGRSIDRVTIQPTEQRAGLCEFAKPVFRPTEDWIERELLISLGGIAAEARHTDHYAWEAAGQDMDFCRSLAEQRAGDARKAERLLKRMLSKVENLLAQEGNWRAVERIAAELLKTGEISGRAARHFFKECQEG